MSRMIKKTGIFALLLISCLSGCNSQQTSSNDRVDTTDSAFIPDSEVSGARIYLYDRGQVTTEIVAEKIIKFESIDSMMAYILDIDIFDSTGMVTTHIVGDSGIIRETTGKMSIFSNVVVTTRDDFKLETDYLYWDSETDKVKSDDFVRITQGDDVMTGWGLEADQQLKSYKILRQVSGTVNDPKKLGKP